MKIVKGLALITLLFSISACIPKHPQAPTVEYYTHAVRYEGETLGLISSWYTGKSSNWKEILAHNPGLDVHSIMIGDQVRIPANMISRKGSLPARIIPKREQIIIEQATTSEQEEIEAQPSVEAITQPEIIEPSVESAGSLVLEQVALFPQEKTPNTSELISTNTEALDAAATQELNTSSENQMPLAQPRRKVPSREELWDALGKAE